MIWGYHYFRKHPFTGVKKNPVSYFKGLLTWQNSTHPIVDAKKPLVALYRLVSDHWGAVGKSSLFLHAKRDMFLPCSRWVYKSQSKDSKLFKQHIYDILTSLPWEFDQYRVCKFTIGDFQINIVSIYTDLRSPKSWILFQGGLHPKKSRLASRWLEGVG